jgi:hypothetical protein
MRVRGGIPNATRLARILQVPAVREGDAQAIQRANDRIQGRWMGMQEWWEFTKTAWLVSLGWLAGFINREVEYAKRAIDRKLNGYEVTSGGS